MVCAQIRPGPGIDVVPKILSYQEDDSDTAESVEGSIRTEVDKPKDELNGHAEHHRIERNIQLGADLLPVSGTGDGSVSGESPRTARSGSCATNATEEGQDQEWHCQRKGPAVISDCDLQDVGNGRGCTDDIFDRWQNEA